MQNMFFLKVLEELERIEPEIEMEEYDLCLEWTEPYFDEETQEWVESDCLEWMAPPPMRLKSSKDEVVEYHAYVLRFTRDDLPRTREVPGVKVGEYDDKDVVHIVSDDLALLTDPDYLTDKYSGMAAIHQDLHDSVYESCYEVEELVEGEMKKVKKRKKKKKRADEGNPGELKFVNIPHVFFGVGA